VNIPIWMFDVALVTFDVTMESHEIDIELLDIDSYFYNSLSDAMFKRNTAVDYLCFLFSQKLNLKCFPSHIRLFTLIYFR